MAPVFCAPCIHVTMCLLPVAGSCYYRNTGGGGRSMFVALYYSSSFRRIFFAARRGATAARGVTFLRTWTAYIARLPTTALLPVAIKTHKKLSYRRGTARCVVSVEICQLPRNSTETTCTTSPEQIEVMKLKRYCKAMCNKHVHSTMTRWSRFRCPVGVINKPTTVELWISPVYRRRAVAKFSKFTM